MQKIWANSGDSHLMEPRDLFTDNLPSEQAERMPHGVLDPDGTFETNHRRWTVVPAQGALCEAAHGRSGDRFKCSREGTGFE